jgi:hypothetical protein
MKTEIDISIPGVRDFCEERNPQRTPSRLLVGRSRNHLQIIKKKSHITRFSYENNNRIDNHEDVDYTYVSYATLATVPHVGTFSPSV